MSITCRSCEAPVKWAMSAKGNWMIFDAEPVTDGRYRIEVKDGVSTAVYVKPEGVGLFAAVIG